MARRIVRLRAPDARAYASVVEPLVPAIERTLGPEVLANRAWGRGRVPTSELEPWRRARRAWHGTIREVVGSDHHGVVLVADVRRCYDSIRPEVLETRLREIDGRPGSVRDVRDWLDRCADRGLPVGPSPSAVLANAVLGVLDDALRETGVRHLRWVDDVVAFAGSRHGAVAALDALRRGMDRVGLEPHDTKTAILADRGAVRARLARHRPSTGGSDPVR